MNSEAIAWQSYYKVHREIQEGKQQSHRSHRKMELYADRITTHRREFALRDVFDMSYRRIGGDIGLLYLHTSTGVFSYNVCEDPREFIQHFKSMPFP
ncbi:hypothetical protein B9G55_14130 [Saccharibacillus sp. O16]|nr:hypothetical protein B9G55_14130 [Saccharibacillus sp. O16]